MIKYIVFDMDGTLLNTLDDLTLSVNHTLKENSLPERTEEEIRMMVGNGIPKLIERAVPKGTAPELEKKCLDEMLVYYKVHALDNTGPYPGINETLSTLKKNGVKTSVVTNKAQAAALELCDNFFPGLFDVCIGDNGNMPLKPDPAGVFLAMKKMGAKADETVFVGDSDTDINTAVNAKLKSVGCLWGFRDLETLKKAGAVYIIDSPEKLLDVVKSNS